MKPFEERHGLPVGTVRVVSCHYFQSQKIFTTEHDPVTSCVANENILVASDLHSVEVRDLEQSGNVSHRFLTVDLVQQIIHCQTGNYIACLELKSSRQSIPIYYVRVYLNWWMEEKNQPMKARIAGRVTPSCQPGDASLEMVEIPLAQGAQGICCCQSSGNLAIIIGSTASIYIFSVKAHDISKQKFIDFNHLTDVQLSFRIQKISLCEDYIACSNNKEVQVFRIMVTSTDYPRERGLAFIGDGNVQTVPVKPSNKSQSSQNEIKACSNQVDESSCVVWDFNEALVNKGSQKWTEQLANESWPLTVHLNSLSEENNFSEDGREGMEICGLTFGNIPAHPVAAEFDPEFVSVDKKTYRQIKIMSLLYKRIPSSTIIGDIETNCLHSMVFIPVYESAEMERSQKLDAAGVPINANYVWSLRQDSPLSSPMCSSLQQVCFFVSTPNEGFLYDMTDMDVCLACQYQYTSICKSVIVDISSIHALTEAGLETYTGRVTHCTMHNMLQNDENVRMYPMRDDPVCLLDLRPFLNIEYLLKSDNHIILISSKDIDSSTESLSCSEATIYSLQKPSPEAVHSNLMNLANEMKSSSSSGYQHLLMEAGMQIKGHLLLSKNHNQMKLYQHWCFLVASYYLCSQNEEENDNCLPYFSMSELPLEYILNKIIKDKSASKKSLLKYLKYVLISERYVEEVSLLPHAIGDSILEFFEEVECEYIGTIVLSSKLHYKLEKAIQILRKQIAEKKNVAQDAVAITVLLEKKGSKGSVQSVLNSLPKDKTFDVLKKHIDLIFNGKDWKVISSYGRVLAHNKPEVLARLLYHLSCQGILSLPEIIVFIQCQSSKPVAGHLPVLQCLAEYMLFETSDLISEIDEASIIDTLVTIYVQNIVTEERQTSISSVMTSQLLKRHTWLNLLPPFNGKVDWKLCKENQVPKSGCQCALCNCFLLKLQAFLCSSYSTPAVKLKVQNMLDANMSGYLSIQLLCAESYSGALELIQKNNQFSVLLQYGVEMFSYDLEKWNSLYNIVLDKRFETKEKDEEYRILNCIVLGILGHLSEHISPSNLIKFIPAGMDQSLYLSYLQKSCDKNQANKMKTKIVSMATELKQMM